MLHDVAIVGARPGRRDAWRSRLPRCAISTSSLSMRAQRGAAAAQRPLARAVARRAPHLRAARRLARRRCDRRARSRRSPRSTFRSAAASAPRARRATSTAFRRSATSCSYRALQAALDAALSRSKRARRAWRRGRRASARHAALRVCRSAMRDGAPIDCVAAWRRRRRRRRCRATSPRHRHDYRQMRVVAKVWTTQPHDGLAYERFTPRRSGGAAARGRSLRAGVDGDARTRRSAAGVCPTRDFLAQLRTHFGIARARFLRVDDRRTFPLSLDVARRDVAPSACVLLGNAAQALHPVAGQGFNLGVRDAYELAQELLRRCRAIKSVRARMLDALRATRRSRSLGGHRVHAWTRSACSATAARCSRWPRGLALTLLDTLPPAKRALTRAMLLRPALNIALQQDRTKSTKQERFLPSRDACAIDARQRDVHRIALNTSTQTRYNPLPSRRNVTTVQHRSASHREQSDRRADGGRDRSAVPPVVQAAGRRAGGVGDGRVQSPLLRGTEKSQRRIDHEGEVEPIVGADRGRRSGDDGRRRALQRAIAARRSSTSTWAARRRRSATSRPARRCCRTSRWSRRSSTRWSRAVDVPVTLKIRTGWSPRNRNAVRIARIAEQRRHRGAVRARPHARMRVRRRRRIRHHPRREARGQHSGHRQRRHRHAGKGARRARATRAPTRS